MSNKKNCCKIVDKPVCVCKSLREMKTCTYHKDSGISQLCCDFKSNDGVCLNNEAGLTCLSKADVFLSKLGYGGTIVCTGDCSETEIILAQDCDRFYVAPNMLGFIYFPKVSSGPVKFRAIRTDLPEHAVGNYFVAPLTDENSGCNSEDGLFFLRGVERHCIQEEGGVVFTIKPETLEIYIRGVWVLLSQLSNTTAVVKRSPLDDGTLPLTEEELETLEEMIGIFFVSKVAYTVGKIRVVGKYDRGTPITNVKAILWLDQLFDLTKKSKSYGDTNG